MSSQPSNSWTGKLGFCSSQRWCCRRSGEPSGNSRTYGRGWKGGPTFLLPYVILSFTLALGLLLAEITLGKAGKRA